MAPHTENLKMLRVVVREDFTKNRCDALIADIKLSQSLLEEMDRDSIKKQQDFIHKHHTASGKATHNHPKYRVSSFSSLFFPAFLFFFLYLFSLFLFSSNLPAPHFLILSFSFDVTNADSMNVERETLAPRQDGQDSRCLLRCTTSRGSVSRCLVEMIDSPRRLRRRGRME
jgi:hypothetical protein